ncbi:AI-2E family transporter [Basilea psittacipulmonis]|uniref:AI-2E family transporter n=1 Tax=Basilea psittacipulmonis TaxID=1472345 RepID=UPI00068F4EAF|nr:AI-2E family transporter [Basilea psittacipulmonis]
MDKSKRNQTIIWVAVGMVCAFLFYILSPVLAPFMLGVAIAYVLAPVVQYLVMMKIPRPVAVGFSVLLLILIILGIILVVFPLLRRELLLVITRIPYWVQLYNTNFAAQVGSFMGVDASIELSAIRSFVQDAVMGTNNMTNSVFEYVLDSSTVVITVVITILLSPIVAIYLLLDWQGFIARTRDLIPRRFLNSAQSLLSDIDSLLSSYLRGQLLVMVILAFYYSIGLTIAGFDSAIPIGILTGMLVFIPYVGIGIGLTLAILTALLQFGDYYGLLAVAIIYGVGQVLEGMVLTPNIMGNRIGLHPLFIIFSVFIFGKLFGFFGVLLALPLCATASVLVRRVYASYRSSTFYTDEQ